MSVLEKINVRALRRRPAHVQCCRCLPPQACWCRHSKPVPLLLLCVHNNMYCIMDEVFATKKPSQLLDLPLLPPGSAVDRPPPARGCAPLQEIEREMARTQKNKATAGHLGMLKASRELWVGHPRHFLRDTRRTCAAGSLAGSSLAFKSTGKTPSGSTFSASALLLPTACRPS